MGLSILILLVLIFLAMAILVRRGARTMQIETGKRWGSTLIVIGAGWLLLALLVWLNFDAVHDYMV